MAASADHLSNFVSITCSHCNLSIKDETHIKPDLVTCHLCGRNYCSDDCHIKDFRVHRLKCKSFDVAPEVSLVDRITEAISQNGELIAELSWAFAEAVGRNLVVIKAMLLKDRLIVGELTQMSPVQYAVKMRTPTECYNTYKRSIWILLIDHKMEYMQPISIPFDQVNDFDWMSM
jgi:hypothetical protein